MNEDKKKQKNVDWVTFYMALFFTISTLELLLFFQIFIIIFSSQQNSVNKKTKIIIFYYVYKYYDKLHLINILS